MSSDIVIRVENLSKRYVLNHQRPGGAGLRHVLQEKLTAPFRWLGGKARGRESAVGRQKSEANSPASAPRPPTSEEFWALKDVSFEIKRGQVVGIIGRNGSGKSTLLKILSRITEPTNGRITINGRVASLLEVGTGFHPELTGRENIFLNGAILGMRQVEIKAKFDEIVTFAEVEKFLDTPVKRYSSGMYVRLAFAVAAHLDPEILIIDEVLAVGDAQFQKKCLGKMQEVSQQAGRSVLFVSHNMAAVRHLCPTAILLEQGQIHLHAESDRVISRYFGGRSQPGTNPATWLYRSRGSRIQITNLEILVDGESSTTVLSGQPLQLRLSYRILAEAPMQKPLSVSFTLYADDLQFTNLWTDYFPDLALRDQNTASITCSIERWPFRDASIRIDVYTHFESEVEDWIENCATFESHAGDYYETGKTVPNSQAICFLNHRWQ